MSGDEARMAWRSWAELASPELLAAFEPEVTPTIRRVKREFSGPIMVGDQHNPELLAECSRALLELACSHDPDYFHERSDHDALD